MIINTNIINININNIFNKLIHYKYFVAAVVVLFCSCCYSNIIIIFVC